MRSCHVRSLPESWSTRGCHLHSLVAPHDGVQYVIPFPPDDGGEWKFVLADLRKFFAENSCADDWSLLSESRLFACPIGALGPSCSDLPSKITLAAEVPRMQEPQPSVSLVS